MDDKIENAVRAVLKIDPDYNPILTDTAVNVLKGRTAASMRKVDKFDHVVPRKKVAEILGIHVNTVDRLVRLGHLKRVRGSGMKGLGISAESLRAFQDARHDEELRKAK